MRFPEFTGEWEKFGFADHLERLENGANYDTNATEGLPMSRIETISSYNINYDKVGHCNSRNIEHYKMKYGDILFSHINSMSHIGKTAYYYAEQPLYHGMNLLLIRCKDNLNSLFFYYLLNTPLFLRYCQIYAKQAVNQASISTSDIKRIKLSLPTLHEQNKIASFISVIDQRIATQNKIIQHLESLITGITQSVVHDNATQKVLLGDILTEKDEKNIENHDVYSVSVSEGVINQIDYLGRSFAAKETKNYNVVEYGDIVYTKSPTGSFPYGIVKQSYIKDKAAVSPLYGVYKPVSFEVGYYLHHYFTSPIYTMNYLYKLIQKGAKNTINITNQHFLKNYIPLPSSEVLDKYGTLVSTVTLKLENEKQILEKFKEQKKYLLSQMFI